MFKNTIHFYASHICLSTNFIVECTLNKTTSNRFANFKTAVNKSRNITYIRTLQTITYIFHFCNWKQQYERLATWLRFRSLPPVFFLTLVKPGLLISVECCPKRVGLFFFCWHKRVLEPLTIRVEFENGTPFICSRLFGLCDFWLVCWSRYSIESEWNYCKCLFVVLIEPKTL